MEHENYGRIDQALLLAVQKRFVPEERPELRLDSLPLAHDP
jgi:hypothetical protein